MGADRWRAVLEPIMAALRIETPARVRVTGMASLPSAFFVTDLAVASIASAGVALEYLRGTAGKTVVDRDLASSWFRASLRPDGWQPPPPWDPVTGDYRGGDGRWVRLHTNAPRHRAAALGVLGVAAERAAVERAVRTWTCDELEAAVVDAGGAAAAMRSIAEWAEHPQGRSVAAEPLAASVGTGARAAAPDFAALTGHRPLTGVRVLDLTRVLAGPVATRLLAGWGAQVLRIDPPDWDEPGVVPEVMLGKRTSRLDLTADTDRERFAQLLAEAHVLVHGYRPQALEDLGFGVAARAALAPALVDVALDAYGWTGPWRGRRGFDSLVQMSCGIAAEGMAAYGSDRPAPLPVQALDHATGYLLAAAVLRGLADRRETGRGSQWRLSLARTARLLLDAGRQDVDVPVPQPSEPVLSPVREATTWGPARRVAPPMLVAGAPLTWEMPARAIGSDAPLWG